MKVKHPWPAGSSSRRHSGGVMADLYEEIVKLKAEGRSAALATIIGTEGSTPRETGAKMLVREDGTILGTIGGGCLEGQVIEEAVMAIREEKPRTVHYDLTGREADRSRDDLRRDPGHLHRADRSHPDGLHLRRRPHLPFRLENQRHGGVPGGGDRRPGRVRKRGTLSGSRAGDRREVLRGLSPVEGQPLGLSGHRDPGACRRPGGPGVGPRPRRPGTSA